MSAFLTYAILSLKSLNAIEPTSNTLHEYLEDNGEIVYEAKDRGYAFSPLLEYLKAKEIYVEDERYNPLMNDLSQKTEQTLIVINSCNNQGLIEQLEPSRHYANELAAFYQEFTGITDTNIGTDMLESINNLYLGLKKVNSETEVLVVLIF